MGEVHNPPTANKLAILSAKTGIPVEALIRDALEAAAGDITAAAEALEISRQALSTQLNRNYPHLLPYEEGTYELTKQAAKRRNRPTREAQSVGK